MDLNRLGDEVDRNFDAFMDELPQMLSAHRGQYVLLRDQKPIGFYADAGSALGAGKREFADGLYSIQEVTDRPADLGFFSHAINSRIA